MDISIHAPREGGDTGKLNIRRSRRRYFNPRPPRGGRQSSRTALMGIFQFQSTPPARGATGQKSSENRQLQISIHAPREGGDATVTANGG